LRYHQASAPTLFREIKPVILYNPHFDPQVSSFFDQGRQLLEALSASGKYNIIFMPHPDLARRIPPLLAELGKLSNIVIAERSRINLDYMAAADIYITDVSSSVFEWLYFNKPVLFFNTKKINWQHNRYYLSWVLGEVAETVSVMMGEIDKALTGPDNFLDQRQAMRSKIFTNQDKNISKLMAEIIWNKLH
jgi:CDP-glycerol glycerophosphotransferase (TagB/SpsB family)